MLPDDPATAFIAIGICLIVFGLILVILAKVWHDNYETGGHDPNHVRPKKMEAWHVEPSGERPTLRHHHRLNGTPDEGTRRLWPTTSEARARVVLIGPEGIEDGEEARRAHHAGTDGRVREPSREGHVEEEGGEDRERGQDEGGPVPNGEEGGEDARPARQAVEGFFKNTVTGEIVFLDAQGRKVEFES